MKKVVLLKELESSDISNGHLYEKYLELLLNDIKELLIKKCELIEVRCPGCDNNNISDRYKKFGLNINICLNCETHYVSPRPCKNDMVNFYKDAKACIFWRQKSLALTEKKLQNLHKSRLDWILELRDEYFNGNVSYLDYETKYPFMINQLNKLSLFNKIYLYDSKLFEQSHLLFINENKLKFTSKTEPKIDIITAFDTIEKMYNPKDLLEFAHHHVKTSGLLMMTTSSCSGFEYQVLGKKAPNINPINRMNLLSYEALEALIDSYGFEIIEMSTPGRLDVEIVRKSLQEDENIHIAPFLNYLLKKKDKRTWKNLQNFLQYNQLSSHVRIAAKKR